MSSIHDYTLLLYNIDILSNRTHTKPVMFCEQYTSREMLKYYRNLRESSSAYNSRTVVFKYQLVHS